MRIAVTGGAGEGKSTVMAMIGALGASTASADEVARDLLSQASLWEQVLLATDLPSHSSRDAFRNALFASSKVRRAVNRILHPLIEARLVEICATFDEIPLLIETCGQMRYDEIWVVTCGRECQRERLTDRYGNGGLAEVILASQLASRARMAFADRVFRTNLPLEDVRQAVETAVYACGHGSVAGSS